LIGLLGATVPDQKILTKAVNGFVLVTGIQGIAHAFGVCDGGFPQPLPHQRLCPEPMPRPEFCPSCRQQLLKLGMAASFKQARQADRGPDHVLEAVVVGPSTPQYPNETIRILIDQIRIAGDLAPTAFDRSQIFDAVVLDRLKQPVQPLASGRMVGRRVDQDWNEIVHGPSNRRPESTRRRVDVLESRPDALHQRHHAIPRSDRVGFRHGPDLGHSFLEPANGEFGPTPAIGASTKLRLELPVPARRHRLHPAAANLVTSTMTLQSHLETNSIIQR
jgi:hypothetical protein